MCSLDRGCVLVGTRTARPLHSDVDMHESFLPSSRNHNHHVYLPEYRVSFFLASELFRGRSFGGTHPFVQEA